MKYKEILIVDGTSRENGYTKKLLEFFKSNVNAENVATFEAYKERVFHQRRSLLVPVSCGRM